MEIKEGKAVEEINEKDLEQAAGGVEYTLEDSKELAARGYSQHNILDGQSCSSYEPDREDRPLRCCLTCAHSIVPALESKYAFCNLGL